MKVFWTQKATKQLDQIFEYIASDSTLYAHRTVGNIIQEAESIMSQPRKGRTPDISPRNLIECKAKGKLCSEAY